MVLISKFVRLFPIIHPNDENSLSQLAECGVIEKITIASRDNDDRPSIIELHQLYGVS
jgi:hypothetical protein